MIKIFIHIILAFSVFFSSAGFWINNHYCQNEFVKSSFVLSFGSCCKADDSNTCEDERGSCNNEAQEEEEGCCHNAPNFYKLDQDQQLQQVEFKSIERLIGWNATIPAINFQLYSIDNRTLHYFNYSSPLIIYDQQVRLQTFLC